MQIESTFMYASELYQSYFRNGLKVINTINMIGIVIEFALPVLDTVMLFYNQNQPSLHRF